MLFDSHTHLNFQEFDADWQEILAACQNNDLWLVNVGTQLATSKKAVAIANSYEKGVYASVGLHPIHVLGSKFHPEDFNLVDYQDLIKSSKKIVAIGETGIDFFHDDKNFAKQKEVFNQHLDLAKEFNLPVIIHARNSRDGKNNAYQEIIKILKERNHSTSSGWQTGVIHCFGGSVSEALEFLKLGFFIGFTGVITFDKAGNLAEVINQLPLDSILIETDAPYLAPNPFRGQRNQPQYVQYVAEKIAEIKKIEYNQVCAATAENAKKLFRV